MHVMQQDILPSTKRIRESARSVSISQEAIGRFCDGFSPEKLSSDGLGEYLGKWDLEKTLSVVCLFNCINFCFWASKDTAKWQIRVGNQALDGATALFRALEEAIERGIPLLDAHFLSAIDQMTLGKILQGNIQIPLLEERVYCLNQAGQVLLDHFDGRFMHVIEEARGDAVQLTDLFIQYFKSFDDHVILDGIKVEFHKRAQLNADMVSFRLKKRGLPELRNADRLTAFADYKVPQILRRLGILKYEKSLAEKIDSYQEIEAGSREEVEIRAATIWAIEEMKHALTPKYPDITSRALDDYLWYLGQTKHPDDKPYHRTHTMYY